MLKFLPYAIQALFILGGLSLGLWLKSGVLSGSSGERAAASHQTEGERGKDKHADNSEHKKPEKKESRGAKKSEKSGHGDAGEGADSAYGYLKFSRQFVVPVVGASGVRSLVVMDINIEMPSAATEQAYLREPKLRDSLLGALLGLSNKGAFNEKILDQSNLDVIREDLLKAARAIIGEDAQNVLILSIARQDV